LDSSSRLHNCKKQKGWGGRGGVGTNLKKEEQNNKIEQEEQGITKSWT